MLCHLINQDFALLFNAETSNMFLKRWETAFKQKKKKILKLPTNPLTSTYSDWDSDMSSVLLLLHLLPSG